MPPAAPGSAPAHAALPRRAIGLAAAALVGCASGRVPERPCDGVAVWVLDRGWHTEIALATPTIEGPLAAFVARFPEAATLRFGFGKRGFMMAARDQRFRELLLGPWPGEGVVQVLASSNLPGPPAIGLALAPASRRAMADFIWGTVARDATGEPLLVGGGAAGVFVAAARGYSLDFTCNAWTAAALAAAGLPIATAGVTLVRDVMRQVSALPAACRA